MIVKDLMEKSEAELLAMLQQIGNEPVAWTPVVLSELTRRSLVRLVESSQRLEASSRRLEKLTRWLVVLTIILGILALPPAVEMVGRLVTTGRVTAARSE